MGGPGPLPLPVPERLESGWPTRDMGVPDRHFQGSHQWTIAGVMGYPVVSSLPVPGRVEPPRAGTISEQVKRGRAGGV
jgi:hypothetical protein